ncbi:hypothetical protein KBB96_08730 [Luteolibacter ambystomatis]|uniref:Uncharacterized protein n=1 Tax=Luteolibacter ambystomatis TaxID=2824561 RepID=A0A975J2Q2_9BACT|nr:hypothetical protein [Luteolibacter ambystomatis]QUE52963.1 hypothetical protein KBB96_08730 [Luteolibacter ambystomatis]
MNAFRCGHCGHVLHVSDGEEGKMMTCSSCQQLTTVPALLKERKTLPLASYVIASTVIAGLMVSLIAVFGDQAGSSGTKGTVIRFAGGFLACVVVGVVTGLVSAGIMTAFKRRFLAVFAKAYSVGVLIMAGLSIMGLLLAPAMRRSSAAREKQKLEEETFLADMNEKAARMAKNAEEGKVLNPEEFKAPAGLSSETDAGKLSRVMNTYLADVAATTTGYTDDLGRTGFSGVLQPERLAEDKDFKETHELLEKGREVVARWREKQERMMEDLPRRIEAAGIGEKTKRDAIAGFKTGFGKTRETSKQMWDLEEEVVEHIADLAGFMEESHGRWRVAEGKIIFKEDADIKRYNDTFAKIEECSEKQTKLRKDAAARTRERIGQDK